MIVTLSAGNLADTVTRAIIALEAGGIIAYPTETFYGLGVRYDNRQALDRLYSLKRRPSQRAMPLIIGDEGQLPLLTFSVNAVARTLMQRFWPGPLTLLFPARPDLPARVVDSGKVAVRVPGPSFALALARAAAIPITATSANISGLPPADTAETAAGSFGTALALVVDGGKTPGGLPSTVVDTTGGTVRILRQGAVIL